MIATVANASSAPRVGSEVANTPGMLGAVMALLLVLALIVAVGWLLKRLPGTGLRANPGLKLIASLPLGAKERLLVVEVAGQQLLLGVSANAITRLHSLPQPLPPERTPTLPDLKRLPNFARLLARASRKDA